MTILRQQWEVTEQGGGEGGFNLRHQVERPTDGTTLAVGSGGWQSQGSIWRRGNACSLPEVPSNSCSLHPPLSLPSELAFSEDPALNWSKRSALHLAFPEATAER